MLRIHFAPERPETVRCAARPDALWEILLSLHALQDPSAALDHDRWRRRVDDRLTPQMRRLVELAPPAGYSPDFLTPLGGSRGVEEGLAAVRATPQHLVRRDLQLLARQNPRSAAARGLLREGAAGLGPLTRTMRAYYDLALAPEWEGLNGAVEQVLGRAAEPRPDRPNAAPAAARLPAPLHRSARWRGPVLEIAYPFPREFHLEGRALHLVPSYFCHRYPITLHDPHLAPVVVYPAGPGRAVPLVADIGPRRRAALEKLLGRTRSAVFEAVADGCTTTELAQRLEISPASASEHTTVLRGSGLIYSNRERNTVCHRVTELGLRLLTHERAEWTR